MSKEVEDLQDELALVLEQLKNERKLRMDALDALLDALDEKISSCALSYDEDGNETLATDPGKFSCASFCENFGHHTLLEIRDILSPTGRNI